MDPKPGDVLAISGAASVQFRGNRSLTFRVIKVDTRPTYHGWVWLTGYVLDQAGNATDRREIFVQRAGLWPLVPTADTRRKPSTTPGRVGRNGASRQAATAVSKSRRLQ